MIKVSYLQFGLLSFTEGGLRVGVGGYSPPSTMGQGCIKQGLALQFTNKHVLFFCFFPPYISSNLLRGYREALGDPVGQGETVNFIFQVGRVASCLYSELTTLPTWNDLLVFVPG